MVDFDGPWEPGDELSWPHLDNAYIAGILGSSVDAPNRVLTLQRIGYEWASDMAMMTHPFSDRENAMMSFIANTLIEGLPTRRIESMSCTIGDVQTAVASYIYGSMEYDLGNDRTSAAAETLYRSVAEQFVMDPRQPGLPLKQRIPAAVHVYEQLQNVEFEVSDTSHGDNVMMGRKPALPITVLDPKGDSDDRATWFLGIFIYHTLLEKSVMDSFLDLGSLPTWNVINRRIK